MERGPRKVLRAPALRRGREIIPITDRAKLEKVLGFTVTCNAAFDCDPHSGIVAYPAGCVVVLYNVRKDKQYHILNSSKKTITSLAFSGDGRYLATGECGHQPHVRVWDMNDKCQVAEFPGHKYGINCVAFSPNLKYVVSVGSQHDMIVNVWDWRNNIKVASNKVSCKVKALSFASNGSYFVTVGNRHVKFWYLEYSRSAKHSLEPVPLMGRSAILGDQRNNYFCDVACGKGDMVQSTYAITKSGLLCEFNSRRLLDKWVELRTTSANSIYVGENSIFIGCSSGIIRCFNPIDLNFICTLPKPHFLGVDVAQGLVGTKLVPSRSSNVKYPDTIAVAFDESSRKVTCIYNDHSLYVWDMKDLKKIGKAHSFLYHSACIWGIETYPELPEDSSSVPPKGTFLTCSSDDTIRFWNLDPLISENSTYHRNIYSSELLKVLYIDPELTYICDTDFNSWTNDKVDTTYDSKNGVRCLRISPDGRHLASGDRSGNIRIHDLESVEEVCKIEAHDSEVLCLEYSKPVTVNGEEQKYLASASRDRLIHVFDVKQDYAFQKTLDDHSSSITAVRFVQSEDQLEMVSCGADKSIIFRKAQFTPQFSLNREHHVVGKTTLYDMEVDIQQNQILTACQDRNIKVYSLVNGKQVRYFRGSQGEDGALIKVVADPSGTYLATSCTDKSLYIYDYIGGDCLATMFGHSEIVTGLKFANDGQHLISVSGDGCIFIWRLPIEVTQTILNKQMMQDNVLPSLWQDERKPPVAVTKSIQMFEENFNSKNENGIDLVNRNGDIGANIPGYRFSIGQLPMWAKKQILDTVPPSVNQKLAPPAPPRGRWAQRIDSQGLVVRSYLDGDSVIPYPNIPDGIENGEKVHDEKMSDVTEADNGKLDIDGSFEEAPQSLKEIMSDSFHEELGGSITLRPTSTSGGASRRENRVCSNVLYNGTSPMRIDDIDAEDERSDSEISEMVFYPISEDGSDIGDISYQVCATNNDNVKTKNTQKPPKSPGSEKMSTTPLINTPDQMETNSDEEEAGTPIDNDKSFLSSLCISTENLERLGQREKFMRNNYESLEKEDSVEMRGYDSDEKVNRLSISAKFLANSHTKKALPNGYPRPPVPERQISTPTSKREELNKVLNDTKKKLENVGYRGGLSSSKSIGDLHNMPEHGGYRQYAKLGTSDSIRRATSMTDLSGSSPSRRRLFSTPSSSKKESNSESHFAPLWNQSKHSTKVSSPVPSHSPHRTSYPLARDVNMTEASNNLPDRTGAVSRSMSTNSLYAKNRTSTPSSTLRSQCAYSLGRTASHQNFDSPSSTGLHNNSTFSPMRRNNLPSLQHSQPLSIVTTSSLATDSSSDSSPTELRSNMFSPPRHEVRQRLASSGDGDCEKPEDLFPEQHAKLNHRTKLKSHSDWDLKNAGRNILPTNRNNLPSLTRKHLEKINYSTSSVPSIVESPSMAANSSFGSYMSSDPMSVPLTTELCENISENLRHVSSYTMQIFQRITMNTDLSCEKKMQMCNLLAQGIWQAQQTFRPAMPVRSLPSSLENCAMGPRRLPGLSSTMSSEESSHNLLPDSHLPHTLAFDTATLLQQYSDRLLHIVEKKISDKACSSQEEPKSN